MNPDFRFEERWCLVLLLALPAAWVYRRRFQRPAGVNFAPVQNLGPAAAPRSPQLWLDPALLGLGCVALIPALARPQASEATSSVRAIGIKIYTIGTGTNGLVPFPTTDQFGNKFYTQEYMPFQEDACRQIARIGHGKFYWATDTHGLNDIFTDIDRLEKHEIAVQEYRTYHDLFTWFAAVGVFLVATGSACGETLWRQIP